jgi:hypothetical protein
LARRGDCRSSIYRCASLPISPWIDLTGLRDPGPLAKLPAAERQEWEKLWQDVKATLADAREPDSAGVNVRG